MNIEFYQNLIDAGLQQPNSEPEFFTYPTAYDLAVPTTGYNTIGDMPSADSTIGHFNAELEPSSQGTP